MAKVSDIKELVRMIKEARCIFVCGNGGSSGTAEHFSSDLMSKGINAVCLNSNTSIMTEIANDFGYDYVFKKQLDVCASKDDLLIVLSGSGNSKNILNALKGEYITFALLGMGGGKAKELANYFYIVNSHDYGVIENEHLRIVHEVKDLL
jgi:D-sedoheptulose 7-phosphate isomerase